MRVFFVHSYSLPWHINRKRGFHRVFALSGLLIPLRNNGLNKSGFILSDFFISSPM